MKNFIVRHFMLKIYLENLLIINVIGVLFKFDSGTVNPAPPYINLL